jgi:hypothetical protein
MFIAISIAALTLLVISGLIAIGSVQRTRTTIAHAAILSMPVELARAKATALIEAGTFSTVLATGEIDLNPLPADVGELLSRYQEISKHEFWLGRSGLSEVARVLGCLKIGGDSDFEEVLVKPGDRRIFLSYPPETIGENPEFLPSIWHKILLVAAEEEVEPRGARRVA